VKIVRFTHGQKAEYGVQYEDAIQGIEDSPYDNLQPTHSYHRFSDIRLLPPCLPTKIVALGVNYHSHGEEMKSSIPTEPLIFIKPSTSIIGTEDKIIYPESSERVDYEGELGVVMKKVAWRVAKEETNDYILGYTCVNDVTARDLQTKDKQWTRAKSFDTFCPIGPCIETEIDPNNLELVTVLNGQIRQQTRTSHLIFNVNTLVSSISHIMTLLPGDIIATGTPSGIGTMQPGDIVEVKIEGIGTLRNYVVRQEPD
jgi:2-keto-4-pentenoate hydratase/2-oxohepta-3-ene-1,7-dioic acid hydratase in catechol pathway